MRPHTSLQLQAPREGWVKSLRARLEVGLVVLLAAVQFLGGLASYRFASEVIHADVDQFVRDKALLLAEATNPLDPGFLTFNDRVWRGDRYTPFGQTFQLDWTPAFVSARLSMPIIPPDHVQREANHPLGMVLYDAEGSDGTRYRLAIARIEHGQKITGFSQIGVRYSDIHKRSNQLALTLAITGLLTLALGWMGIRFWLQQWRGPLKTFEHTARDVLAHGVSYHRFVAPPDAPELALVARSFNQLLDRLSTGQSAQQRFVADASHELRTPLTVLRGELEVALRRERSGEEYRETIRSCREEIERLSKIADNLLALARSDAGGDVAVLEPMDLGTLARSAAEEWRPWAAEKGVRLTVDAVESIPIRGDPLSLERVLGNLIDNALRYTPAGEELRIGARRVGREGSVEVQDQGPGIAAEHLDRIFDRFYRVESVRSRERGGAGLGLAIVKAVVEAHGGTVKVRSEVGVGTVFEVRLPIAPEAKTA